MCRSIRIAQDGDPHDDQALGMVQSIRLPTRQHPRPRRAHQLQRRLEAALPMCRLGRVYL